MTFRRAVWLSVILHGLIVVVSVTRTFFAPSEPLQLQDAIRVDIVGLPQKIPPTKPCRPSRRPRPRPKRRSPRRPRSPRPNPRRPPKPEAPKFVEKPKPEKPVDVKKSQANALNHLREMDAFAKLEKAAAERKAPRPGPPPRRRPRTPGRTRRSRPTRSRPATV